MGGGGGTLKLSYVRRLGPFWGVQNFEFQNIYFFGGGGGGVRKMKIFSGVKISWVFVFVFFFGGGVT